MSGWLRIFNIVFGIISILLSFIVITDLGIGLSALIFILASVILGLGITRIINGIFNENQTKLIRILKIVLGVFMLPLSIVVMSIPDLGLNIIIFLLAGALIANGLIRIIAGGYEDKHPSWFRILMILIGAITVLLGVITIIKTDFSLFTLLILLAVTLIINGIARIMYGITGYEANTK